MKYQLTFILLFVLLVLLFLLDLALGSVAIPIEALLSLPFTSSEGLSLEQNIVFKLRLPQALTAILSGAALSAAGLQMQTFFRNPLVGPSILGITSGASLGVGLLVLASGSSVGWLMLQQFSTLGQWLMVLVAALGSALVMFIIVLVANWVHDNVVLLIVGMMLGNLTTALVGLGQYFSQPEQIQDYLMWTFGSLGGLDFGQLQVLSVFVALGTLGAFLLAKPLNNMLLGDNYARSLGVHIGRMRLLLIIMSSLLAGSVTAFCGPIGFIGIAVPHLTRMLFKTADHRVLIPAVCLLGAGLMLICDIIAKLPGSPISLPINAVTALIGSPIVIMIILKNRHLQRSF